MFWRPLALLWLAIATHTNLSISQDSDPLQYINPLIGSNNGGNVFAGATLPYAMAKAVADVDGQNTGGFATDGSNIIGFSSMHDSGTGGNPSLGNFPLFPQYCPGDELDNCKFPKAARATPYLNGSVLATPGYFKVSLQSGISVDMTTSEHAALYRFNFPNNPSNGTAHPLILLDLDDLWSSRQNASISVDSTKGRISGNGTFLPSFGAGYYVLHFCVDFVGANVYDSGMWVNDRAGTEPHELFVKRGFNNFYLTAGGWMRFERPSSGTVTARMGMSYISTAQACRNAENEIPNPATDFERLQTRTEDEWRLKLSPLSIQLGGAPESLRTFLYSGIYRGMIDPQNYTGENPLWSSDIPYFDSFYWYVRISCPLINFQGQMFYSLIIAKF
jgi:putative alpha-1,2-mannosidase